MFASIGNTVANQVWEETLQTVEQDLINIPEQGGFGGSGSFDASIKPTASSTRKEKETYVKNKYVERLYVNRTTQDNAEEIGTALIDAAAKGDMKKLVRHVAWKTNLDYVSVHGGKRSSVCRRCVVGVSSVCRRCVVGVVCLCLLRCVFFCIRVHLPARFLSSAFATIALCFQQQRRCPQQPIVDIQHLSHSCC
jgi:hypothetical protein